MRLRFVTALSLVFLGLSASSLSVSMAYGEQPVAQMASAPAASATSAAVGVLPGEDVRGLMPPMVFFRGKSASVQLRNSAGVRFQGGGLLLAGLVDTSGYSSAVQERYQAYLLLDAPATVAGHVLSPGAYGIGFVKPSSFVVMDLGGKDLFVAESHQDAELRRPTPLQILTESGGGFRLYAGRTFVSIGAAGTGVAP